MLGRVGDEPTELRGGPLRRWFAWRHPRSFRQKLALSIAGAALLTAFIEGALDIFFDAQVARFRQENTDLLSQESATIALFLEFDGDAVRLSEEALDRLEPDTRFRLLQDDEVVLGGPHPFPDDNNAWAVREGFVGGDYRLEIARPTSPAERFILNELWLDLLDLPLFFPAGVRRRLAAVAFCAPAGARADPRLARDGAAGVADPHRGPSWRRRAERDGAQL